MDGQISVKEAMVACLIASFIGGIFCGLRISDRDHLEGELFRERAATAYTTFAREETHDQMKLSIDMCDEMEGALWQYVPGVGKVPDRTISTAEFDRMVEVVEANRHKRKVMLSLTPFRTL